MLVKETVVKGMVIEEKTKYIDGEITDKTAHKKQQIIDVISLGSQLTLLGVLIQQLGDKVGLNTPEFTLAKQKFSEIQAILKQ